MLLEIACFNIGSALAAAQAGADRIELCDNSTEGGTTPSIGTIKLALEKISIPVFPIIRPRGGDFLYDEDEFATMLYDVEQCKELGCKGVVLGLLQKDGSIDVKRTKQLVEAAREMEITFHKAFDEAREMHKALEDVIATGCKRLLTSGQKVNAIQGSKSIKQLISQASNRIIIMPGGGIRSNNIADLINYTNAIEYHSGARATQQTEMEYTNSINANAGKLLADTEEIRQIKRQLNTLQHIYL